MGCDCSAPEQGEEKLLDEASKSKLKGQQNTQKPTPSSLEDSEEAALDTYPTPKPKPKQTNNLTWYLHTEQKDKGDILEQLCIIIGEKNKKHIETAISNVETKDDINAVCQYLLNTAIDMDAVEKPKHECKDSIHSCISFVRITMVLQVYIKWIETAECGQSLSLYEAIHKELGDKQAIDAGEILNDFHHLMLNHNTDEDFEIMYAKLAQKQLVIPINKSEIILRNYRDRSKMNNKQRKDLYFGYNESTDVTIIQLLDRIYCFYVYSFDIGMRLRNVEKLRILYAVNDSEEELEGEKDAKLVCMSSILLQKQINLVNVLGKNKMEINKYYTQKKTNEAVIFFYKDFESKSDEIILNHGREYQEKDWFIAAKYTNLKDEVLQNEQCNINKTEFDDLMILSQLQIKSNYNSGLRESIHSYVHLEEDSEAVQSWGMNEQHVLAAMLYCNFTMVQYELKQTYFRFSEEETNIDLKKRHSMFANLGRLLKEIVNEYGTECKNYDIFYHSVDIKLISATLIKLRAPTSTSNSKVVLFNYASVSGGIVMELNCGDLDLISGQKAKYFDCSLISDFAVEEEKLFISQKDCMLELSSMINISTYCSYLLCVSVFNVICTAFGEVNESWSQDKKNPFEPLEMLKIKKKKIKSLTKKILESRGQNVQAHLFGKKKKKYKLDETENGRMILQLLEQFAIVKKEMILFWFSEKTYELWPWIDEVLEFMRESCFCKDLKDDKKWLKLDLLALFFMNLESVTIVECEINESILTDVDLFIQKLQIDPKEKYKKKETEQKEVEVKEESELDKLQLMGIDLESIVSDLHSDKSHISFKDPSFDDLCDYRQCKIKEIKILQSYDDHNDEKSFMTESMFRKYNRKFKKCGWQMVKDKIMGSKQGYVFRKIKK